MKHRTQTLMIGALAITTLLGACSDDKKSSGGTSDGAYCAQIESYKAKADELDAVMNGTDADAMKNAFTTMQGMLHSLDKNPPASIAEDVHLMTDAADKMIAIFSKYDWDFTKLATAPEFQELSTLMSDPKYTAANEHLDTYTKDTCGLDTSS